MCYVGLKVAGFVPDANRPKRMGFSLVQIIKRSGLEPDRFSAVGPLQGPPCFAYIAIKQECTRITPMDKDELKERIRVPFLGFSAVLMSIVAFLLLLYGITVVVRFLFALGSLW